MPPQSRASASAEPLITATDAVSTYAQQLNFLAVVQTLLAGVAASTLQAEVANDARGVRAALLYMTLMLELSALVLVVCIGLKAVANFALRAHSAASPKQLLILTSVLAPVEERLFGWACVVTLAGMVCFGAYGSALMPVSNGGVWLFASVAVAHVCGGLVYFYHGAHTSPHDCARRLRLKDVRARTAAAYGASEMGALKLRYA